MQQSPRGAARPDMDKAVAQYRERAQRYDLELMPFEPVRSRAIAAMALCQGDVVLDVGCGTGLSFAALKEGVGTRGRVVGIDPSPEMLALARERVARHHWSGIELQQAAAGAALLHTRADAALFHFTHDVLQDPACLDHVLAHLRPGAHVVAAGLQWAPYWFVPVNMFVLGAAMYSVTCLSGLERPWKLLAERLREVEVSTLGGGGIYIARGVV